MSETAGQARSRTGYHHGDLREALLEAAESLLREEGLGGLTLRACARRAGVSHAAPKHHFPDVSTLLSEVAARGFDRLTEALVAAREAAGGDPGRRFTAAARTYVTFARRHPAHFRLMFRSDGLDPCNRTLAAASARAFAELTGTITRLRGEPDVAPAELAERVQDAALMEDVLLGWSHVHGYAQLLLEGQLAAFAGEEQLDDFIERTVGANSRRLSDLLGQRGEDGAW